MIETLNQQPKSEMILIALGVAAIYACYRRYARISVSHVPGPEPESFLLGNLPEIFQSQAGVPDFKYQRQFGDVIRIKGPFGVRNRPP